MKTAIVTGACSAMGKAICQKLHSDGFQVIKWCRCRGIDLARKDYMFVYFSNLKAVIHIAELGPDVLRWLWKLTRDTLIEHGGTFIALSSIHHLFSDDAYARSKREQEKIMREFAEQNGRVRVNVLRLGHIVGTKAWPREDPEQIQNIPMGRFGTVADVAQAVRFLIQSQWITGTILTLDGGMTLKSK